MDMNIKQFGKTFASYASSHMPRHSKSDFAGSDSGKHAGRTTKGSLHKTLYRPEHGKGASGYTGKHAGGVDQ